MNKLILFVFAAFLIVGIYSHAHHHHHDHDDDKSHEKHDHDDKSHEKHDHDDHKHTDDDSHEKHDHDHKDHDHKNHDHKDHDHKNHNHTDHDHKNHNHTDHDHKNHNHTDDDHDHHHHHHHHHEHDHLSDEEKKKMRELYDGCITKSGVDRQVFEDMKAGKNFTVTKELNCFSACVFKIHGVMNEDGTVNNNKTDDSAAAKECKKLTGSDVCDTAGKIMGCLYEHKLIPKYHGDYTKKNN